MPEFSVGHFVMPPLGGFRSGFGRADHPAHAHYGSFLKARLRLPFRRWLLLDLRLG
jgi:hypothetical protein